MRVRLYAELQFIALLSVPSRVRLALPDLLDPVLQQPRWNVDQLPDGRFPWTTPSGRDYITEPTRHPI